VNFYRDNPIQLCLGEEVRLYLANLMEYEPLSSFHLHANFFKLFRTGIRSQPAESTDVVTLSQAERCMLEFSYRFPGRYMFHPHQNAVAERGCMGHFQVS
jgi:FtsP/CotA-like multicopper oxidase with cupredoxin domain